MKSEIEIIKWINALKRELNDPHTNDLDSDLIRDEIKTLEHVLK